jgi:basic membrane lipoprotein Med (substrate-binding protein (PBP1-ABC) superfamily)
VRSTVVWILGAIMALTGCSGTQAAKDLATQACFLPGPVAEPGFNPETADLSDLVESASIAKRRAEIAEEAAQQDERWRNLSDATRAIATFANVLVDARMDGVPVTDATTPQMWDQAKYAQDAFQAECRGLAP